MGLTGRSLFGEPVASVIRVKRPILFTFVRRARPDPMSAPWSTLDQLYAETRELQTKSERIVAERHAIRQRNADCGCAGRHTGVVQGCVRLRQWTSTLAH